MLIFNCSQRVFILGFSLVILFIFFPISVSDALTSPKRSPSSDSLFIEAPNLSNQLFSTIEKSHLTLDGQDDYGVLSKSGMIPTGGSNYTVELWFKKDTFDKGYREMLSQWTKENISNSFYLGMDNGNMRFTDSWNSVPVGELRTDTWYHLAAVSTPNNAYLYINGELKATKGMALTYTGSGPLVLGRQGELNAEYFDGVISDVRVWNTARTQEQIQEKMTQVV
ncbi:LamG domain-containing protein, partial [Paenibacillus tyrfis]|uniref:LamG domain-containing protein n=1 Tax=Paenibacillus tyrfis TaxID=1501230 RepID=UPI000561AD3E